MAKNLLGIDIGCSRLKLTLVNGTTVKKTAVADVPENLVRSGSVISVEAMGDLIRETMRTNGIRCNRAAMVLSGETVFVRRISMPKMTEEQLLFNLPYEFHDYISDDPNNYLFDYAMLSTPEDTADGKPMDLLAAAVSKKVMEQCRAIARRAGLKLKKAAPAVSAYAELIRWQNDPEAEYCILDLGHQAVRIHMFRGDCSTVTRELEFGLNTLDELLAEEYGVDFHLAHTYLRTNHGNCQSQPRCEAVYNKIAVELMHAVSFYRYSSTDSSLRDVWLCGGGAEIFPLVNVLNHMPDLAVHQAAELICGGEEIEDCASLIQAIGIAAEQAGG